MKERVLLLHGWGGSDYPHWQSWLAGELKRRAHTAATPHSVSTDSPSR